MSTLDQPDTTSTALNAASRPARTGSEGDRCAHCAELLAESATKASLLRAGDADSADESKSNKDLVTAEAPSASCAAARGRILLDAYRSLPRNLHRHSEARVAVQDAIADLLRFASVASAHPGAVMLGAVHNAFAQVTAKECAVQTREYFTLRVANPDGGPVSRHRALPVRMTVMRNHAVRTPTSFSELVDGFGDDLGDHDSPEFLSSAVSEAGWRLWDQATGEGP